MKAAVLDTSNYTFSIKEVPEPTLSDTDVLVNLKAAALNHHELWSLQEKNLQSTSDVILGSDGAGIIVKVGSAIDTTLIGEEVVINPSINWGDNKHVHSTNYEILGFPTQGTFAEYIRIDAKYIHKKPKHLSFEEAAAFPLAGLTAYRALFTRGEFELNKTVLITGIGGGAALLAFRFAIAMGTQVFVTSGDDNKIIKAIELGAQGGVNYKKKNWSSDLLKKAGGFDIIIDSAAGQGFTDLTELTNPGGNIVLFGRTMGLIPSLSPKTIFWKQLSIHGTTMGNEEEFKKMVKLIDIKKIQPVIDSIFPLEKIGSGFDKMESGQQFGKIVIKIGD